MVTVDLGDGDVGVRRRSADHTHTGPMRHQGDSQVVKAGRETDVFEAEAAQERRDFGDDGDVACRVLLLDLHDAPGDCLLHALLQLPRGRPDAERQRDRRRPDVAELLHVLADACRHTGDRDVALRVQLHHIPPQGQGLPRGGASAARGSRVLSGQVAERVAHAVVTLQRRVRQTCQYPQRLLRPSAGARRLRTRCSSWQPDRHLKATRVRLDERYV